MRARYHCARCGRGGEWFLTTKDQWEAAVARRWEAHQQRCPAREATT